MPVSEVIRNFKITSSLREEGGAVKEPLSL